MNAKALTCSELVRSECSEIYSLHHLAVTLDHKTSHKGQFCFIEMYTASERWINKVSIDVWFVRMGQQYLAEAQYLKIWNLRVQKIKYNYWENWFNIFKFTLKLTLTLLKTPEVFPILHAVCIRRSANGLRAWHLRLRLTYMPIICLNLVIFMSFQTHNTLVKIRFCGKAILRYV